MQHLPRKIFTSRQLNGPVRYLALTITSLIIGIWQVTKPVCEQLDLMVFDWLNGSLIYSHTWQIVWGYLNHPYESWLNVVWMVVINILGIYTLSRDKWRIAWIEVIYFWLMFQVVLFLTHQIFFAWLSLSRWSPSLVVDAWVDLNESLGIGGLKVSSHRSFPAGHALVLIYWLCFTNSYCVRAIKYLTWFTLVVLLMPRMISGAHWATDVVFTIFYGCFWYQVVKNIPLYQVAVRWLGWLFSNSGRIGLKLG